MRKIIYTGQSDPLGPWLTYADTPEEAARLEQALEPLPDDDQAPLLFARHRSPPGGPWLAFLLAGAFIGLFAFGLLLIAVGG